MIAVGFSDSINLERNPLMAELRAYLRERLPLTRFGPLALLLALLGGAPKLERVSMIGLALILIAVFRLRDDLADRSRDAVEHPDRVLVRTSRLEPFELALRLGLLAAFVLISLTLGLGRGASLLALALGFELGYRLNLPHRQDWVLLKYPCFVVLLGDDVTAAIVALCYLSFAVFEYVDDESLWARPRTKLRLLAYMIAAGLIAAICLRDANAPLLWFVALAALWSLCFAYVFAAEHTIGARLGLFLITLLLWSHHHFSGHPPGTLDARDVGLLLTPNLLSHKHLNLAGQTVASRKGLT